MNKVTKAFKILVTKGSNEVIKKIRSRYQSGNRSLFINKQYQVWFNKHYPDSSDLRKHSMAIKKFGFRPIISIITPTYNTPLQYLKECIESVLKQTYVNWELCIVDDASTDTDIHNLLANYSHADKRIKIKYRKKNGDVVLTSNDGLKLATGQFIAFLDHDDMLWPNALYEVVRLLNHKPSAQFIYSDEDKIDEDGKTHVDPFFKPDWSPDYLRSINYITHFALIKKSLVNKVRGFRIGYEGAQDWDLYLRATRKLEKDFNCHPLNKNSPIQHISTILYSWRKSSRSTASEKYASNKSYAYRNQKKVLEDDLKLRKLRGEIIPSQFLGLWNIKYKIKGNPLVSVIIPTIDHYDLILKCFRSILEKTDYGNFELMIVDTGSKDKKVWSLYEEIKNRHPQTQVLQWNKQFNFSAVCNFASQKSRGEYLVFLNNDTEILAGEWLEVLLEYAQQPHIGSVGMKLVYPNNKIQHAGIVFDPKNKLDAMILPDHLYKNYKDGYDYGLENSGIYGVKNFLAVTAACMMIKTKIFKQIGGFNEQYQIAFNDVDLGIRLSKMGLYNVSVNWLKILHYESSTTKKPDDHSRDIQLFKKELHMLCNTWKPTIIRDPFINPNLETY